MTPLRLVRHAPTEAALIRARSNARNLLALRPDAQVEIVVNAKGAAAALTAPDPATDRLLVFCANSLRQQGLPRPEGRIVEAAVLHIAHRQSEGWAYRRA